MGILVRKQKGIYVYTGIAKLALAGFIVAMSMAFVNTIWAVYMDSFLNNMALVGFISAALTVVSFASYFYFIPFIEKNDKAKIYSYAVLLFTLVYILFAINTNFILFLIIAFFFTIIITLKITSYGIMIKDMSAKKSLSKNEGLTYTAANVAWVIGPLIAGFVATKYNINSVFVIAAIFSFIAFIFFKFSNVKDGNTKKRLDKNMLKNFCSFFKSRERAISYLLSGGVNLWWILIYLFIPLYIIRNNLGAEWIGYFLFGVAVPLILFEFYFAKLAGKIGFKKIFKIGYLIPAILCLFCFAVISFNLFGAYNIYVVLGSLILCSFGMSMLEPTTEAYFFDILDKKEVLRYYGPYNTTIEVNHLIGKVLASTLLIFLAFEYIFVLFAAFMFILFLVSFKIKDIIEEKR